MAKGREIPGPSRSLRAAETPPRPKNSGHEQNDEQADAFPDVPQVLEPPAVEAGNAQHPRHSYEERRSSEDRLVPPGRDVGLRPFIGPADER